MAALIGRALGERCEESYLSLVLRGTGDAGQASFGPGLEQLHLARE
jgi:hypothetical protein